MKLGMGLRMAERESERLGEGTVSVGAGAMEGGATEGAGDGVATDSVGDEAHGRSSCEWFRRWNTLSSLN